MKGALKDTTNGSLNANATPDEVLRNVDSMIAKMRGLKRKLNALADEETRLQQQTNSRIQHLNELYNMQSLDDVKYEAWSRTRLDRLLVDYLLRHGYKESATALAKEKNIEELVDVDTFVQMDKIRGNLLKGRVNEALIWCNENKKELRKAEVCPAHYWRGPADGSFRATSNSCCDISNTLNLCGQKIRESSWSR